MANIRTIGTGDTKGATTAMVTTAETIALTCDPVPTPNEVALIFVLGIISWTAGAGTTSVNCRFRRGAALTSPQVGDTYPHAAGAGLSNSAVIAATDQVDNNYTVQYSLTLQQVGATGNGTITSAQILVITF